MGLSDAGLRALALRVLALALLIAGAVAVLAVLTGSFDEADSNLILSIVGFGVFSAAAAIGADLDGVAGPRLRLVARTAVVSSAIAFVLLLVALWSESEEGYWRAWGVASLVSLWATHACAILGSARDDDASSVRVASLVAVVALGIEAAVGIAILADLLQRLEAGPARFLAALLIVGIVASVLVPVLRRLAAASAPAAPARPGTTDASRRGTAEPADREPPRSGALAWLVAAAAVAAGFALGWAVHRPDDTPATSVAAAVQPATTTVTVTTPPPPATITSTTFTPADGRRVIRRRRSGFDRRATADLDTLASLVELCFADTEDFTLCNTAAALPDAGKLGLAWGTGTEQVSVTASDVASYTISSTSRSGTTFTLTRTSAGRQRRDCNSAGSGACRRDGSW